MIQVEKGPLSSIANMFKLLGNETRLAIVLILYERECCVCEIVDLLDMSQPAISQHLRRLKDANLIQEERRGQWVYYNLAKNSPVIPWIEEIAPAIHERVEWKEKLKQLNVDCS